MSDSGVGFGPVGPAAADGPPFTVTGPSTLVLNAGRSGSGSFTVSNVTGRPVRARLLVLPGAGADASWFQVVGEAERALPSAGTATVDVAVTVNRDAPAGTYSFVLGAALEESPDQVVSGPTVSFEAKARERRFPWWMVIVAAVAVLVLIGGGLLVWLLTRPGEPEPTPSPTSSPTLSGPPILRTDRVVLDTGVLQVDLDLDGVDDIQLSDADLAGAVPAERPTTVFGHMRGVAIVPEPTFEQCRDVFLSESVEVPEADDAFVCVFTSEGHAGVLEFRQTQPDQTREVLVTVWD